MSNLTPLFDVKLIATGKQHFYQLGDDEIMRPGVTTALSMINKPALVQWASNTACQNIKEELMKYKEGSLNLTSEAIEAICLAGKDLYKKKAQEAADIGSKVHNAINQIIITGQPMDEYSPEIAPGVQGFLNWKAQEGLEIDLGDTKLGSRVFGYGGSMDWLAFEGSEPIIFDLKTTKRRKDADHGIYPEYAYQLAAYAQAFKETYGLEVKKVYCLWVNKEKPEFKAVKIANLAGAFEAFLAALTLYKMSKWEMLEI